MVSAAALILLLAGVLPAEAPAAGGQTALAAPETSTRPATASLVVLGFENRIDERPWRDQRLGVGLRGRLAQMCADSGAFALLEERGLAPSIREALGGYWLREKSAEELADLASFHRSTGAEWIA